MLAVHANHQRIALGQGKVFSAPHLPMALGWLLFSEPITWRMVIAVAVIVTGVCLIVSTKSDEPAKTRHPMTSGHGKRRAVSHAVGRPVAGN
jgi:hypothetical protein